MHLTGMEIVNRGLVSGAETAKVDDGSTPSYGPDPAGYTLRADVDWKEYMLLPLRSVKFKTLERVRIPVDHVGLLFCKSTYARQGVILVTNTPADGGYEGPLTVRLFNSGDEPVTLFGRGGFMQIVFGKAEGEETAHYSGRWAGGQMDHEELTRQMAEVQIEQFR